MEHTNSALRGIWYKLKTFFVVCKEKYKDLFVSPLFLVPLILKCIAAFFLASSFATELFIPFIKYYVFVGEVDPYTFFYTRGIFNAFPYPSLMLSILSLPYFVAGWFSESIHYGVRLVDLFVLRIPLLLADIGILVVLLSWFNKRKKEVLWLYWCSPILFYITYVHGQLDVLPVFFLFCFLYFLFKEYDHTAFIFLGLAVSVKTGMIIVLPFVAMYLLKERTNIGATISKLSIPFTVFLVLNLPYLHNKAFIEMVLKTKEQFKVFDLVFYYNQTLLIYIVPIAFSFLLFKFFTFKKYSRDLFMVFLGFSFFILTLCIPPMQGWYYWVIPFAVYFYSKGNMYQKVLNYGMIVAYFLYFAVVPQSDFFSVFALSSQKISAIDNFYTYGKVLGLPVDFIVNLAFTLLQSFLLLTIYLIYRKGIQQYIRYKIHYQPFLIGVAGDSGSGKSSFAELMQGVFAPRNVSVIAGDDMHKWERGDEMWSKYTHLDPLANELHADIKNVYAIKQGNAITRRHYDHITGTFTEPKRYEAKRLVIFEGLHAFFLDKVRKAFDLKVYVAPEDQIRLHWKILRDARERGYSKEKTLEILEKRKDDSERFIAVQEKHSDIIISLRNDVSLGKLVGSEGVELSLSLFITCANDIFLEPLLDELMKYFSIDYLIHDAKQRIKFTGSLDASAVRSIADKILPELDEISKENREWASGYQGVMQLFVTFYMFQLMTLDDYGK